MKVVCEGIKSIAKKPPTALEIEEAKGRLRNHYLWHIYTIKNTNIAITDPKKLQAVAEHGEKNSKKAVETIRNLGSQMIIDNLKIYIAHFLKAYAHKKEYDFSEFLSLVAQLTKMLTPLLKTILIATKEGRNKLLKDDEMVLSKAQTLNFVSSTPTLKIQTYENKTPVVACATTILNQLFQIFLFESMIIFRNDLNIFHNGQQLAPTYMHACLIVKCPVTDRCVLVDPLYKQYLTGCKNLPNEDVLVMESVDETISQYKQSLKVNLPTSLHANLNKLWEVGEYSLVPYNGYAEQLFSPHRDGLQYHRLKGTLQAREEFFQRKGLIELLMTHDMHETIEKLKEKVEEAKLKTGLTEAIVTNILRKISYLPPGGRSYFIEETIGLDKRSHPFSRCDVTGYLSYLQSMINPKNTPLRAVYGAAGTDFFSLSMLNATDLYLVDILPLNFNEMSNLLKPEEYNKVTANRAIRDLLIKYCEVKLLNGGVSEEHFNTCREIIFLFEMTTMGVELAKIRLEKAPEFDGFRMYYSRRLYDRNKKGYTDLKECTLTYVKADLTKPQNYPQGFKKVLDEGIDLYMQKGSANIPAKYSTYMSRISSAVRENGYLLTNDMSSEGVYYEIEGHIKNFGEIITTEHLSYLEDMVQTPFFDYVSFENGKPVNQNTLYVMEYNLLMDLRKKTSVSETVHS